MSHLCASLACGWPGLPKCAHSGASTPARRTWIVFSPLVRCFGIFSAPNMPRTVDASRRSGGSCSKRKLSPSPTFTAVPINVSFRSIILFVMSPAARTRVRLRSKRLAPANTKVVAARPTTKPLMKSSETPYSLASRFLCASALSALLFTVACTRRLAALIAGMQVLLHVVCMCFVAAFMRGARVCASASHWCTAAFLACPKVLEAFFAWSRKIVSVISSILLVRRCSAALSTKSERDILHATERTR
mmetsp:Transcript_7756/g.20513  ORF Transcript_7756/g.20513 Transcript_7756/m.20513 type:complete len:247 (-) Transcript_7756:106-846(-)